MIYLCSSKVALQVISLSSKLNRNGREKLEKILDNNERLHYTRGFGCIHRETCNNCTLLCSKIDYGNQCTKVAVESFVGNHQSATTTGEELSKLVICKSWSFPQVKSQEVVEIRFSSCSRSHHSWNGFHHVICIINENSKTQTAVNTSIPFSGPTGRGRGAAVGRI